MRSTGVVCVRACVGSGVKNNTFQVCRAQAATVHVASDVIVTRRCRANDRFHEIARARACAPLEGTCARPQEAGFETFTLEAEFSRSLHREQPAGWACLHLTRARNFHRRAPFTPILLFLSSASFSAFHVLLSLLPFPSFVLFSLFFSSTFLSLHSSSIYSLLVIPLPAIFVFFFIFYFCLFFSSLTSLSLLLVLFIG